MREKHGVHCAVNTPTFVNIGVNMETNLKSKEIRHALKKHVWNDEDFKKKLSFLYHYNNISSLLAMVAGYCWGWGLDGNNGWSLCVTIPLLLIFVLRGLFSLGLEANDSAPTVLMPGLLTSTILRPKIMALEKEEKKDKEISFYTKYVCGKYDAIGESINSRIQELTLNNDTLGRCECSQNDTVYMVISRIGAQINTLRELKRRAENERRAFTDQIGALSQEYAKANKVQLIISSMATIEETKAFIEATEDKLIQVRSLAEGFLGQAKKIEDTQATIVSLPEIGEIYNIA
jgi:hypothetical protein